MGGFAPQDAVLRVDQSVLYFPLQTGGVEIPKVFVQGGVEHFGFLKVLEIKRAEN
jgi:hypothetical protein